MCAVVVDVLEKWAQHRTTDDADDNVAQWGSWTIGLLATKETRPFWLAAGAEGVFRGIVAADTSVASRKAKSFARYARGELGLQA